MTIIDMDKVGEALNTKADIDLNNTGVFSTSEGGVVNLISSTPANANGKEVTSADFFQSNLLNYTTNRILEIPQDIKLELNNGALTLKAGSKVYVPNGAGTFNAVTIASDVSTERQDNQDCIAWYNTDTGTIQLFPSILFYSGTTAPSGYQFMFWYDITNNKCKVTSDSGSTWVEGKSFPICVVSTDGTKVSAIKQVFNGFGYIGSTIFVLPGIKCLVGNGRNPDGSCITKIEESTKVSTFTTVINRPNNKIVLYNGMVGAGFNFLFNEQANMCYDYNGVNSVYRPMAILGTFSTETTSPWNITEFNPLGVDSLANSNASNFSQAGRSYLSGLGMPSGRYINLTLLASGSSYTAPANGYFIMYGVATAANAYVYFVGAGMNPRFYSPLSGGTAAGFCPAKKGQSFRIDYGNINTSADSSSLRFIYAEGEN